MRIPGQRVTSEEIKELQEQFMLAVSYIPKSNQRFYHVNSAENFINSLSLFMDAALQEQIFIQLQEYVHFIRNNVILNTGESLAIFNKFLRPLSKYYEIGLDFTLHIKLSIFIMIFLFLAITLYIIGLSFFFIMAILVLACFLYFRNYKKSRQGKAYAFMW
jgi:hypothetical protein